MARKQPNGLRIRPSSIVPPNVPERFAIRTGFAYSPKAGASQQGDLLVIDENHPAAYYFREGDFAVALPEAIACVIEVKTRLNKRTFQEAMTALHSFRKVSTSIHPISYLFAYEGPPFTQKTLSPWYNSVLDVPDEPHNYPWAIYALNQGILIFRADSKDTYGHNPIDEGPARGPKLRSLSVFLQSIRKSILLYSGNPMNPYEFAALEGLTKTNMAYRFGPDKPAA